MAGFVPTQLIYLSEDRTRRIEVWNLHDGPIPRWIPLGGWEAAHLISMHEVSSQPSVDDLVLRPLREFDIEVLAYERAERWWQDGMAPWIPDKVEANRLKEQYESFEDMRSNLERVLEVEAQAGGKIVARYEGD